MPKIKTPLPEPTVWGPVPIVEVAKDINMALDDDLTPKEETEAYEDTLASRDDDPTKMEDAISALVNLGYQRLEAYKAVNQAMIKAPDADMSELIRLALKEFAMKD